jgi:DNA polymerase (family 10)
MMYFTGSKEHNVRMRERALKHGLTLNEYGLYPHDPDAELPPQDRGASPIAGATEADVFSALGLVEVQPEIREDRGEFVITEPVQLIEHPHIRAELHAHTRASDGTLSIDELIALAESRGLHTIAVTDHSRSSVQANGLSIERLREHIASVHDARSRFPTMNVLAGSEVDILADGHLDYPDDVLRELDIVVASPHAALAQESAKATERLTRAIESGRIDILGHPTGRLVNRREGLHPDMDVIVQAAARCRVALEINAHWMRLDLRDVHARAAMQAGAFIAINCDVHASSDFDNIRYGLLTARRGWVTPDRCLNTWSASQLNEWLHARRK